jgi:hypothetical protein
MADIATIVLAWLLAYEVWKSWRLKEQVRVLERALDLERQISEIEGRAGRNNPPPGEEKGD